MGRTGIRRASFREGIRAQIAELFDGFIAHRTALESPRRIEQLHEMRLAGKPLRYAMEVAEPVFRNDFGGCLVEVKNLLTLMGEIHDCDVHLASLRTHLVELQIFNRTAGERNRTLRTGGIRSLILAQRKRRLRLFADLRAQSLRWETDNFRQRLDASMNT